MGAEQLGAGIAGAVEVGDPPLDPAVGRGRERYRGRIGEGVRGPARPGARAAPAPKFDQAHAGLWIRDRECERARHVVRALRGRGDRAGWRPRCPRCRRARHPPRRPGTGQEAGPDQPAAVILRGPGREPGVVEGRRAGEAARGRHVGLTRAHRVVGLLQLDVEGRVAREEADARRPGRDAADRHRRCLSGDGVGRRHGRAAGRTEVRDEQGTPDVLKALTFDLALLQAPVVDVRDPDDGVIQALLGHVQDHDVARAPDVAASILRPLDLVEWRGQCLEQDPATVEGREVVREEPKVGRLRAHFAGRLPVREVLDRVRRLDETHLRAAGGVVHRELVALVREVARDPKRAVRRIHQRYGRARRGDRRGALGDVVDDDVGRVLALRVVVADLTEEGRVVVERQDLVGDGRAADGAAREAPVRDVDLVDRLRPVEPADYQAAHATLVQHVERERVVVRPRQPDRIEPGNRVREDRPVDVPEQVHDQVVELGWGVDCARDPEAVLVHPLGRRLEAGLVEERLRKPSALDRVRQELPDDVDRIRVLANDAEGVL